MIFRRFNADPKERCQPVERALATDTLVVTDQQQPTDDDLHRRPCPRRLVVKATKNIPRIENECLAVVCSDPRT